MVLITRVRYPKNRRNLNINNRKKMIGNRISSQITKEIKVKTDNSTRDSFKR